MLNAEDESIVKDIVSEGSVIIYDGYGFFKFIEALSKIQDDVRFSLDHVKKELRIEILDDARISLMSVIIGNAVNDIECTGSGEAVIISLDDLKDLLRVKKSVGKQCKLIFGDAEKLLIEKSNLNDWGLVKKSIAYLDMEIEEMPMDNLNAIEPPNMFGINKRLLDDMFYESGNYSEVCEIETNKDGVYFREKGLIGEHEAFYEFDILRELDCEDIGSITNSYSYKYLNVIKNFLKIMDIDNIIRFYQKQDHPLKIVIYFESIGTTITYYIAPRVEEADWEDDDDDDEF